MKHAGEIKILKVDTRTKMEQAEQKQKLKEFQFRMMTYFQEQQRKKELNKIVSIDVAKNLLLLPLRFYEGKIHMIAMLVWDMNRG